jgi:hypothetical protein
MSGRAKYKYEVAFSFLAQDLETAKRLADMVSPLSTFVYSRHQEEIAARDGMDKFGAVFGRESRLNVILYREGYGDKGWTNFEQETIKGRCLREGWQHFVLLRLDESTIPPWVPTTYIYGDLKTMDLAGFAAVIRSRANSEGADVQPESPAQTIARRVAGLRFREETEMLATGADALRAMRENLAQIMAFVTAHIQTMADPPLYGEIGGQPAQFGVNLGNAGFYLTQRQRFGAVTSVTVLLRFFEQRVAIDGRTVMLGTPEEHERYEVAVTRSPDLGWCWLLNERPASSEQVAELIVDELVRINEMERPDDTD